MPYLHQKSPHKVRFCDTIDWDAEERKSELGCLHRKLRQAARKERRKSRNRRRRSSSKMNAFDVDAINKTLRFFMDKDNNLLLCITVRTNGTQGYDFEKLVETAFNTVGITTNGCAMVPGRDHSFRADGSYDLVEHMQEGVMNTKLLEFQARKTRDSIDLPSDEARAAFQAVSHHTLMPQLCEYAHKRDTAHIQLYYQRQHILATMKTDRLLQDSVRKFFNCEDFGSGSDEDKYQVFMVTQFADLSHKCKAALVELYDDLTFQLVTGIKPRTDILEESSNSNSSSANGNDTTTDSGSSSDSRKSTSSSLSMSSFDGELSGFDSFTDSDDWNSSDNGSNDEDQENRPPSAYNQVHGDGGSTSSEYTDPF